jgi:hypothetical protein
MKEAGIDVSASFYFNGSMGVVVMGKEMALVRDKVYEMVFEDLFTRYVLKRIRGGLFRA